MGVILIDGSLTSDPYEEARIVRIVYAGQKLLRLVGHHDPVTSRKWSEGGTQIISDVEDGPTRVWPTR